MKKRRHDDEVWLFVIAGAFGLFFAFAAGGLLSALLSGHGLPTHHVAGSLSAWAHTSDPSFAWRTPVGPAWLYWSATSVVFAVTVIVASFMTRIVRRDMRKNADDPTRISGLADRHDVMVAAGAKHLLQRGSILRPSVVKPTSKDLGLFLGSSRGVDCYASVEDSMVILGPPRSGKGYNLVIPFILDAPGAVVTTSTRPDNLAATMTARMRRGPVGVFDPQGLAKGIAGGLRWSPIRGCELPQTAMLRAGALCAGAAGRVEGGNFWQQQTEVVVRCLLQAAAVDRRSVSDLYRWSLSPDEAKEA
ncbi:MAG TPA: type IV secretory system conjugative DNA transfer family protein, partial [Acidimicrobiales bacterium]|nr:type IV secretory system conjugative DNA transfer family protein [Acidimicrobiales bacterium]